MRSKIFFVAVMVAVCFVVSAYAEDGIKIPTPKTGIAWNVNSGANDLLSISVVEVVSYKGFSVNTGVATKLGNEAKGIPTGSLQYNLGALAAYGVNVPFGDKIEVGGFIGRDFTERENSIGVCATGSIKF